MSESVIPISALRPRGEYVIFERKHRGQTPSGIHMPDVSLEGIDHVIVAVGPKVEDLNVGDKVIMVGQKGQDYGEVPNMKNVFLTKQQNVVLIIDPYESEIPEAA